MLVLVTRPREQAAETARRLRALGHEPLLDPVLEIRQLPLAPPAFEGVAAIAITSANAAPVLASVPVALPVYAVGVATARAARAVGRAEVHSADGDGIDLAAVLRRSLTASAGTILHLAGEDVREGLEGCLVAAGYRSRRAVVYAAAPAPDVGGEVAAAIAARRVDAALFFSPRSAALWTVRIEAAGLAGDLAGTLAACLSEAVAAGLAGLPFKAVRVAASRDQNALLRCLEGRW